jgi:phospholipid transport system transporter-binding protein
MAFRPTVLTMEEAADTVRTGLQALAGGETEFDLASLQRFDSAAVTALLAWQRAAGAGGKSLRIMNRPAGLDSLARLYGVDHLLHR